MVCVNPFEGCLPLGRDKSLLGRVSRKLPTGYFVSLAIILVPNRSFSRSSNKSGCTEYYRYPRFCVPNRAKLASKKVSHMEVAS